jgi:thymidine phosphorylase
VIRRKRDGAALSRDEVKKFISGLTDGSISEGQAAAFAMAVFFNGLSHEEAVGLTLAMRDSGTVLHWDLPGPVVDKHSSGGVGDNVSLMLAPMLAACGCFVPMISGRGLGHTGGTLDKLDSIPGYQSQPGLDLFRKVTREAGCAIIGQTADLAPADKRLYGIRDVTGTVESIPLITTSILSKKLAAGLEYLVLDVKMGSGAFMATMEEARGLAESLVAVANGAGLKTTALITDMDEPLASCAGNAIEVQNAVDYLTDKHRDHRLHQVTMELGAALLVNTGLAIDAEEAHAKLAASLDSGAAAECFAKMVALLGGPKDFIEKAESYLPRTTDEFVVTASAEMIVESIDTRNLGLAVIELGGGRRVATDAIDHAVGLTKLAHKGQHLKAGDPIACVHYKDVAVLAKVGPLVMQSYHARRNLAVGPVVLERIGP